MYKPFTNKLSIDIVLRPILEENLEIWPTDTASKWSKEQCDEIFNKHWDNVRWFKRIKGDILRVLDESNSSAFAVQINNRLITCQQLSVLIYPKGCLDRVVSTSAYNESIISVILSYFELLQKKSKTPLGQHRLSFSYGCMEVILNISCYSSQN